MCHQRVLAFACFHLQIHLATLNLGVQRMQQQQSFTTSFGMSQADRTNHNGKVMVILSWQDKIKPYSLTKAASLFTSSILEGSVCRQIAYLVPLESSACGLSGWYGEMPSQQASQLAAGQLPEIPEEAALVKQTCGAV